MNDRKTTVYSKVINPVWDLLKSQNFEPVPNWKQLLDDSVSIASALPEGSPEQRLAELMCVAVQQYYHEMEKIYNARIY